MDTRFMCAFTKDLAARGLRVARFEFPYMAERRKSGKRRPPDREPVLRATWLDLIQSLGADGLVIGGKSMGGRIASLIADEAGVAGLVCLGYPFHPVGKPAQLRTEHLRHLRVPALILQGERDPFGSKDEVAAYELAPTIAVHWLRDGDHNFKPRASSGVTEQENWSEAATAIVRFISRLAEANR
jgi:hypothetical protein